MLNFFTSSLKQQFHSINILQSPASQGPLKADSEMPQVLIFSLPLGRDLMLSRSWMYVCLFPSSYQFTDHRLLSDLLLSEYISPVSGLHGYSCSTIFALEFSDLPMT